MMRLLRASVIALSLLTSAATASAEGAWVLWEHSYEVWVDSNRENHRRDGYWKNSLSRWPSRTATTVGCARREPSTTN
jgi:hypothetical protein